MTLRLLIFVGLAVCDARSGVRYQKTFPCVSRLKCSTVIGCCVIMTFGALSCVAFGVYRSVSQYYLLCQATGHLAGQEISRISWDPIMYLC